MASFDLAIPTILKHEGHKFTDDPADHGGATKYGVSLRYLKSLGQDGDIDHDGDIDRDDVLALTEEKAKELYKRDWDHLPLEHVSEQTAATKVFDMAVNMGPYQAVKLLQRAIVTYGKRPLAIDGRFGGLTLVAANAVEPERLVAALRVVALDFYRDIITNHPDQAKWADGWEIRAAS